MGSLNKIYNKQKLNGIVFTPENIVNKILNEINYNNKNILGKLIIDPACGNGKFIVEILKKIISFSPIENLKENLKCIYGWEISEDSVNQCIENLNELIKPFDITVNWNIKVFDPIKNYKSINEKFDFVVGNPPYIRIQHMNEKLRNHIRKNFKFCNSGAIDIYIAFFELTFKIMKSTGISGLITPNTYFYTETAKSLRNYFAENQYLTKIFNYKEFQVFDAATTYSAITIFNKKLNENFVYEDLSNNHTNSNRIINYTELKNKKFWQLSANTPRKINGKKLEEICSIHVGITTLCDKAYIFEIEQLNDEYVYALTKYKGKIKIEKSILKPIVKGSRLKNSNTFKKEYILFPYYKNKTNKHKIIPENILKNKSPFAYEYLLSIKDILDNRDNGKPNQIAWYAFGRHQALDSSFGEKIIFSPINKKPNFIYLKNPELTIYSGYFIKYKGNIDKLLMQLNSKYMEEYISISSRDFRQGWKAYNKKILEQFIVETSKL